MASRQPAPSFLQALHPRTVMVFRALQLGDMLCAVPALRALRAALPEAAITLVGLPWARRLAERLPPYVDDFVPFPGFPGLPEQPANGEALPGFFAAMRRQRFDLALQLHGDGRLTNAVVARCGAAALGGFRPAGEGGGPGFLRYPDHGHEIRRLLALTAFLGAPPCGEQLEFPLLPADAAELEAAAAAHVLPPEGYVCLHPGARAADKRWPPASFAAVGDALHEAFGLAVALTGSEQEIALTGAVCRAMRAPAVDTAGPISVGALGLILARARLLVCNDTGAAHLATALGVPSVVIFRCTDMARWAPLDGRLHRGVWDPAGHAVNAVVAQARDLLGAAPARPRAGAPAPAPAATAPMPSPAPRRR